MMLRGHKRDVMCLAISADGTKLFSGSDDKTVRVWLVSDGATDHCADTFEGHTDSVYVTFWSDFRHLNCFKLDVRVHMQAQSAVFSQMHFETGDMVLICPLLRPFSAVRLCIAVSRDGTKLFSGSCDTTIRVWSVATGKTLQVLDSHSNCEHR